MEAPFELEGLRILHQDLIALEEGHLRNIDKLCEEIRGHTEAFRKLLDKSQKSEASRLKLTSGTFSYLDSPQNREISRLTNPRTRRHCSDRRE